MIDWSNKDVFYYFKEFDLPYHPLWEQGYPSVGDVHTTTKWGTGMSEEQTRFFGLKRECGLHEEKVASTTVPASDPRAMLRARKKRPATAGRFVC